MEHNTKKQHISDPPKEKLGEQKRNMIDKKAEKKKDWGTQVDRERDTYIHRVNKRKKLGR